MEKPCVLAVFSAQALLSCDYENLFIKVRGAFDEERTVQSPKVFHVDTTS